MKAYRYNTKKREDRRFNTCGAEKNPLNIKFYASNLTYADNYKCVYTRDGELDYTCELQITEITENNLFDMDANFGLLVTYKNYVTKLIGKQIAHYAEMMNKAKTNKDRKFWFGFISDLEKNETNIIASLRGQEFQDLSDFTTQIDLVSELKSLGFSGYQTKNEIAIF